ncbi:MAG: hypothetical protein FJW94_08575 [Actinobacteria bacterium]|nr:hypothetical protein [Actinomycetota bacterium]
MGTFRRSLALFSASWAVLRHDKELIVLPIVASIVSALAVSPFLIGVFLTGSGSTTTDGSVSIGVLGWVLLFLAYVVGAYVTIFFQSALVLAANDRLTGGNPTLGSALTMAGQNAGRILPWAIISATVSVVLQAIQERAGFIGRIVVGLVGLAWTLVTMLVLPILVIEQVGVGDALKRSASAFKRTWGENVVGNGGVGLIGFLLFLIGMIVAGPIIFIGASNSNVPITVIGVVLLVAWIVLVTAFTSALSAVFRTALYRYAVLGEEPGGFTHDMIAGAFRPKPERAGLA